MSNTFEGYEDYVDENDHSDIEKTPRSGYMVMVRFRNQKDYNEFADLLGQPALKVYSRAVIRKTVWPTPKADNALFL